MADAGSPGEEPVHARKVPRDVVRPQTVVERQGSIGSYLLRRSARRREMFLLRSRTTTIRQELRRALFLTGCIALDLLLIPETIFLVPGPLGWSITAVGFVVAVWLEFGYYSRHFALRAQPSLEP